jgi:tetratricopeptide (TPR) repeat protein
MQSERTDRLADLVASALECAVAERAQFLSDVCGNDVALREEAESLLRFEKNARDFIETPAFDLAPKIVPNGIIESVTEQEPVFQNEATVDFESEFQSLEIERSDSEEIVLAAPPDKPRPKYEPASHLAESIRKPFETPALATLEHIPPRPAEFVWARRAALIVVGLLVIALLILLSSAVREAKKARHQRDLALAEQSRTEQTNNFLQRILSFSDQSVTSVWPVAQKRNVTVSEMLDRIVPEVDSEFADQPDLRGDMLRRIGNAYASQGEHDAAERNLRAALQTQTTFYGEQNAQITETMIDLGALLYRREQFPEAERFLEKGVVFLRKQNQAQGGRFNAVKLAYALDQLGAVKLYRGDVKGSRGILEEALQVATRALPDERDRSILTNIKTDLGGLLVLVGELKRGEILLQESFAESRTRTTIPRWEAGITLQMLGELELARNRPREAGESFLDAELIYRETLGERNLYFARNLERRATVLLIQNDLSAAEDLAQRSLAIAKGCSPENKLPLTDPMMTLSDILIKEGRVAEGEDYLRKTIRICEDQSTRNYAAITLAKIRLSQLFLAQHRLTEAENVAFEIHSQAQQHLDPQDPMRKAAANNLIQIYEAQEKHGAARAVK